MIETTLPPPWRFLPAPPARWVWAPRLSAAPLIAALLSATLLAAASWATATAAPKAEPWPHWERHDPANRLHIDHGAWNDLLQRNLDPKHPSGIHRVRYAQVSRVDRLLLDAYLGQMSHMAISRFGRPEQRVYWINVYNALTMRLVLDHLPVKSIRAIRPSGVLSFDGPWDAKLITVEGEALSLDDIEHRILRPGWHDPRVHYALNCASLGCPNLARDAYTFFNVERQLDEGARAFVNHPRGVRFQDGRLIVSSLYVWYQEDFGGDTAGVLAHLRHYAEPELAAQLAAWQGGIEDAYDWRLNAP